MLRLGRVQCQDRELLQTRAARFFTCAKRNQVPFQAIETPEEVAYRRQLSQYAKVRFWEAGKLVFPQQQAMACGDVFYVPAGQDWQRHSSIAERERNANSRARLIE